MFSVMIQLLIKRANSIMPPSKLRAIYQCPLITNFASLSMKLKIIQRFVGGGNQFQRLAISIYSVISCIECAIISGNLESQASFCDYGHDFD